MATRLINQSDGTASSGIAVVTIAVSLFTQPKPEDELRGLVWGLPPRESWFANRSRFIGATVTHPQAPAHRQARIRVVPPQIQAGSRSFPPQLCS